MGKHDQYRTLISKLRRLAQILPNIDKIIFELRSDGKSFDMLLQVPSMKENVKFGVLNIPNDFIKFLKSPNAPTDKHSPDKAYLYLADNHILDIDVSTSLKEYKTITNSINLLKSGDVKKINEFIFSGFDNVSVNTKVDTDTIPRNQKHNEFISSFMNWKRSMEGKGVSVPHMANRRKK